MDEQNKPLEQAPATAHANQDERSRGVPELAGLTGEGSVDAGADRAVSGNRASTACDQVPMGHLPDEHAPRGSGPDWDAAVSPGGPLEGHTELEHASPAAARRGARGEQPGTVLEPSDEQEEQEELEEEALEEIADVEPLEEVIVQPAGEEDIQKEWYILKVQSNREPSICDGLQRRVAIAGLERFFGEVIVPTEDVAEFKNGKRRVVKRKLYPGYIVVNMAINDETWFLVRETPGIGDFTGSAGRPTPMLPHEVERIVKSGKSQDEGGEPIKTALPFKQGDRVRIKDGTFENFDGDVESIDEANGRVTVMINIFGRSTPVELEHWQIDAV